MIKLKHKLTGREWNYSATVWFKRGYNINDYDILEWYDVVELFNKNTTPPTSLGKMEKRDAMKEVDSKHYLRLAFEDVPKPSDYLDTTSGEFLQITPPNMQETIHQINTIQNGTGLFRNWSKTISVKNIIEMIIAGLIVAALIYLWHLNAVRK